MEVEDQEGKAVDVGQPEGERVSELHKLIEGWEGDGTSDGPSE